MAESSIFWTTGSTGDGASPYTQTQIIDWLRRTFIKDPASEGVLKGYANGLAPSGSSSPVAIATGAAMVYGFPYENTTSVNVAIPTPVIGTTGHRIVLRANWTAQTVRITLISSSDGVAAIPAATQSAGATWDVTLATLTITTGGVITLTDAREYIRPNLDVDDAVVGERVPQFHRRQGGSATGWDTYGSTTYTPGKVRMQAGTCHVTIDDGDTIGTATVTFPTAFSERPIVMATLYIGLGEGEESLEVATEPSASVVYVYLKRAGVTGIKTCDVFWLAIGPE